MAGLTLRTNSLLSIVALIFCIPLACADAQVELLGAKVVILSQAEAAEFLGKPDDFVKALSPFDRQARLKSDKPVDQEQYLNFVRQQAKDWTAEEKQQLTQDFRSIAQKIKEFKIQLPESILLIKTTGLEEGGAAYTRGPAIILPERRVTAARRGQEGLLTHELFHVLSRHDGVVREKLYNAIGFKKCQPLQWPAEMQELRLTNPDGPHADHCIEIKHDGESVWAIPVLFSKSAYDAAKGGEFFRYMTFKLMVIESPGPQQPTKPKLKDGLPILIEPQTAEGFMTQIGKNTGYIIHPDEVLADNFVLITSQRQQVESPELLSKLKDCLVGAR